MGVDYASHKPEIERIDIDPNELTAAEDKDFFAGPTIHKHMLTNIVNLGDLKP